MNSETTESNGKETPDRLASVKRLLTKIAGLHKQSRGGTSDRWYYCGICKDGRHKAERYPCKTLRLVNRALDEIEVPESKSKVKTSPVSAAESASVAAAGGQ